MPSSVYESYDAPAGDLDITTHPHGVQQVAAEIAQQLGPWPPASTVAHVAASPAPSAIDCAAILVTGPRAVGTSMVAWQVLMASVASGHWTGYLDLEQLAFLSPTLRARSLTTKLANIATCWAGFRNQGARRLVLCGHVDRHELDALRDLVPSLRVVALTAAPATLLERAQRRSRLKDVWLPGDDLFGRDDAHLRDVVHQSGTIEPDQADRVIATDAVTPAEIAALVTPQWPDAPSKSAAPLVNHRHHRDDDQGRQQQLDR
jgi:hypothetical protein